MSLTIANDEKNPAGSGATSLVRAIEDVSMHDHLCLIYANKEEQFAAVVPFMRIGLERGEKCVYIADDNTVDEVLASMRAGGIDVDAALKKGSLAVITKREAYLRNGYFDPDEMIRFLTDSTNAAKKEGYSALRATGEMTWMLGGEKGTDRLIEYEAKLNRFFPANDALAICQYNRQRFSPAILLDVIHTHPIVVVGNTVCRNFYYVPVDEFLMAGKGTSEEVDRLLKNLLDRQTIETEYKKAIHYSEELIRFSNAMIVCLDLEGRVTAFNEVAEKVTGYRKDEVLGRNWFEIIAPRNRYPKVWEVFEEFKKKRESIIGDFENPILTKSGEERIIEWRNSDLHDDGAVIGTISYGIDVTERKSAEKKLSESERELREAQRVGRIGNWSWDIATDTITWSKEYYHLFGLDPTQHPPNYEEHLKIYTPESAALLDAAVKKNTETGEPYEIDLEIARPTDSVRWITARSETIRNEEGKVIGLRGTAQDITERKVAGEALKKNEERLRFEVDRMPIGHILWDKNFLVVTWNPAAEKIFGFTSEEAIGKHPYDLIVPKSAQPQVNDVWGRLLAGDESARSVNENTTKDGRTIICDWVNTPLKQPDGAVIGVLSMVQDVTEQKEAEQKSQEHLEEIENINKLMVGRELKMIELKNEIEKLKAKLASE
ncbi:MAG: MEDS domain-containing protein [Candidatus Pacebacteria bacterium]|nr:MEDS domain-containing protein [Candidatus Paceibacterota bacterium]